MTPRITASALTAALLLTASTGANAAVGADVGNAVNTVMTSGITSAVTEVRQPAPANGGIVLRDASPCRRFIEPYKNLKEYERLLDIDVKAARARVDAAQLVLKRLRAAQPRQPDLITAQQLEYNRLEVEWKRALEAQGRITPDLTRVRAALIACLSNEFYIPKPDTRGLYTEADMRRIEEYLRSLIPPTTSAPR